MFRFYIIISIFIHSTFAVTCFQSSDINPIPVIFGGETGNTAFTVMARNTNGDFAIGATSTSQDIQAVSFPPFPAILYYDPSFTLQWNVRISSNFDEINALVFDLQDSAKLIAALNKESAKPTTLIWLDSSGNILAKYKMMITYNSGASSLTQNFIFDVKQKGLLLHGNNLRIGGIDNFDSFNIIKFTLGSTPINFLYQIGFSYGWVNCIQEIFVSSTEYFIAGTDRLINTVSGNYLRYASVYKVVESSTSPFYSISQVFSYEQQQVATTDPFFFVKFIHYCDGNKFVAILENTDPTLGLIQVTYDIASLVLTGQLSNFIDSGGLSLTVHGLCSRGPSDYWIYVQHGTLFKYAKLKPTAIQWDVFPLQGGQMKFALIFAQTIGYYIGYLTTVDNIYTTRSYTYSKQVAFLMPFTIDASSCVQYTYVLQTAISNPATYTISTHTPNLRSWLTQLTNANVYLDTSSELITTIINTNIATKLYCTPTHLITTPIISPINYQVDNPTYISPAHGNFDALCDDQIFTLSLEYLIGGVVQATLPAFVTYDPILQTISVYSNSNAFAGTHTMQVKAILNNFQIAYAPFNIIIASNPCQGVIINPDTIISPQSYNVQDGTLFTLASTSGWITSIPLCGTIVFSIINQDNTVDTSGLFSITGTDVQVQTTDPTKVNSYMVKLVGTLGTYDVKEVLFTVNVIDDCQTVSLTSTTIATGLKYDIQSNIAANLVQNPFTLTNLGICTQTLNYQLLERNTLITADIIFSLSLGSVSVNTQLRSKIGTHNLRIIATLNSYPSITLFEDFDIQIYDSCDTTSIVTVPIPTPQNHEIQTGYQELGSTAWTQTSLTCNVPITFQIIDLNSAILNPIFSISATNKVIVQLATTLDVNYYNLRLEGKIQNGAYLYTSQNINFDVNIYSCQIAIIVPTNVADQEYTIGQGSLSFSFNQWSENTNLCGPFTYTLSVLPITSFITLTGNQIQMQSISPLDAGSYIATITGQIPFPKSSSVTFNLKVLLPPNNPPYFTTPLLDQYVTSGKYVAYTLPQIQDDEKDIYSEFVMLNTANLFATYSSSNRKVNIRPSRSQASGEHVVLINLRDFNLYNPKNQTYFFNIYVTQNDTNQTEVTNSTFNVTQSEKRSRVTNMDDLNINLDARIKEISNAGLVTIKFSMDLLEIANISSIDDQLLNIYIDPGDAQDPSKLQFKWEVVSFEGDTMKIQLKFNDPLYISSGYVNLILIFYRPKICQTLNLLEMDSFKRQLQIKLFNQITKYLNHCRSKWRENVTFIYDIIDDTEKLQKIGDKANSATQTMLIGNFAINLIMSASLQFLWGMINTLQLIVHVPLFTITFPANAQFMYSIIVDVTNFQIIPESIQERFFNFIGLKEDEDAFKPEFDQLDIFQIRIFYLQPLQLFKLQLVKSLKKFRHDILYITWNGSIKFVVLTFKSIIFQMW